MFVVTDTNSYVHIFMLYRCKNCITPSSESSLRIIIEKKAKENFRTAAILSFHIL